jgi:hypothetical protein
VVLAESMQSYYTVVRHCGVDHHCTIDDH